jgi:hypothetical protein
LPPQTGFSDTPDFEQYSKSPGCFTAVVANTWTAPIGIRVERGGQELDISTFARIPSGSGVNITYAPLPDGKLPPGQVAILFLSHDDRKPADPGKPDLRSKVLCPSEVGVAFTGNPAVWGNGFGQGFHITTTAPVVAYDIYPYGGAGKEATGSASLLLPTASWDTNYIAVTPWSYSGSGYPYVGIMAMEDGTEVNFRPSVPIAGGGVIPSAEMGKVSTYSLARGQYVQLVQFEELAGSVIQSNKPVGVWGCMDASPVGLGNIGAADTLRQQIPAVRALGNEYVAVRHRDRYPSKEESPPWRFVGAVDDTKLTYEPAIPTGAPATLRAGEVVSFRAPGPFIVKSQDADHPFYAAGYMTGMGENMSVAGFDYHGDPDFVNIIPSAQYLNAYTFFTDPTYSETSLVVVRKNWGDGFKDVRLDCAGILSDWKPIDAAGVYQFTRIDLVRGIFEPQGSCDNGVHQINSEGAFGLTVWGWGSNAAGTASTSYAYPGGAGLKPINKVFVPAVPK